MRIGEFADHNGLSIDTVRYYVDLNIIHPVRRGKYFYFEKEQQDELDRLLHLKKLRFTLEEIKKIATAEEFEKIKMAVKSSTYRDMVVQKREELGREMSELAEAIGELDSEIEGMAEKHDDAYRERGIGFKNLELLCCPRCGRDIEITEGILRGNGIYEGKGECRCGYSLSINQGIVVTEHDCNNIIEPYMDDHDYIDDALSEAPKTYMDLMINSNKEVMRLLSEKGLSDKTVFILKSGIGVLGISLLEQSGDMGLMILVDEDFNKLKVAKRSIETYFPGSNVIYMCSEVYELPIKQKTIDIAVDFLASFINGFRSGINMYGHVIPMLKIESSIIGFFMYFKLFRMLSRLPEPNRKLFDGRTIPETIKANGYVETGSYEEPVLYEGSNINGFFQEGDSVHSKIMVFDRKGQR